MSLAEPLSTTPGFSSPNFFSRSQPTPMAGVFLGTCVSALHRGVALGDLIDAIVSAPLGGPWITWAEINHFVEVVADIAARPDVPDDAWMAYCVENRIDPVSGATIVLSAVIDEVSR